MDDPVIQQIKQQISELESKYKVEHDKWVNKGNFNGNHFNNASLIARRLLMKRKELEYYIKHTNGVTNDTINKG